MTASQSGERLEGGGIEQKGKGLMDMDNCVVITGWGIRAINSNGTIQLKNKKYPNKKV